MANSQPVVMHKTVFSDNNFSLKNTIAHVTRKAGFKTINSGYAAKRSWSRTWRVVIEGNTAAERYRRYAYEGSHRVTAAILGEKNRIRHADPHSGGQIDVADNALVKSRFWRQDNIRFNSELQDHRSTLGSRNKWAARISRWAHHANGLTELGAAPTGMLLKISKITTTPNLNDKTLLSQMRVFVALALITPVVALFGKHALGNILGSTSRAATESIKKDVLNVAGSFSAVSAIASMFSLAFGGISASLTSKAPLNDNLTATIQNNHDRHISRLYLLLDDAKNKPSAQVLLRKALKKYIPENYRNPDKQPILLSRLLNDVRGADSPDDAKQAMEKTIGSYLTEADPTGRDSGQMLDLKKNKTELLKRENHFVAMTNLIEHCTIDTEVKDPGFQDLRHSIEKGAEIGGDWLGKKMPKILNGLGMSKLANRSAFRNTPEFKAAKEARDNSPFFAAARHRSGAKILENSHQYGPITVGLARFSEVVRVFNHGILLSLNYQLTRPIAWAAGRLSEKMLKMPNSRCTSFSIGRFFASAAWAILDALIIGLAAGRGVIFNGTEAHSSMHFPLNIKMGVLSLPISVVSTAVQMIFVSIPAMVLMGAAKLACSLEGWKGDISNTGDRYQKRQLLEAWS